MEEAELRSWIEKLQARLQACGLDSPQQLQVVLESLVMKKQSLCEMLQSWNGRSESRPTFSYVLLGIDQLIKPQFDLKFIRICCLYL